MEGAYPVDVLTSLRRIASKGLIDASVSEEAKKYVSKESEAHRQKLNKFVPLPHPLDYDWRFTKITAERLAFLSLSLSRADDTISFLGAPTVYRKILSKRAKRNLILIDKNPEYKIGFGSKKGAFFNLDLQKDELPIYSATVIIIDPPWYPDYQTAFLWASSRLCSIGGYVLMCLPSILTRPGVQIENRKMTCWASKLGLRKVHRFDHFISYESPYFERNTLYQAGIKNYPNDWRHADLVIFSKIEQNHVPRPRMFAEGAKWTILPFGIRVRYRHTDAGRFEDPRLISIVPNDVLPTISKRDRRRELVDVWSSGNRVFACRGTMILAQIVKAIASHIPPEQAVESMIGRQLSEWEIQMVTEASWQINEIVHLETPESYSRVN